MHTEAKTFTLFVKKWFPAFFCNKTVLDAGGGDINGNNRELFTDCDYQCNDVVECPNANIVCFTKDLPFADATFDTIVSTECFEHDPQYTESWQKIYKLLKPGGLFFFTCASTGRKEHGTKTSYSESSYACIGNLPEFCDYYKNLSIEDLHDVLDLRKSFSSFASYYNKKSADLYFWGIKSIPHYNEPHVNNLISTFI